MRCRKIVARDKEKRPINVSWCVCTPKQWISRNIKRAHGMPHQIYYKTFGFHFAYNGSTIGVCTKEIYDKNRDVLCRRNGYVGSALRK